MLLWAVMLIPHWLLNIIPSVCLPPQVAESYCSGAQQGQHGSLGYGVQWCAFAPAAGPGGVSNCDVDGNEMRQQRSLAVTCSFYDRSLHLWEPAI